MNRDEMYLSLGVSDKVLQFGEAVLDELKPRFAGIEEIAELNQAKVIGAMQKNRVNATHFAASTGYGYDDEGRDNLERVYASAFHTEAKVSSVLYTSVAPITMPCAPTTALQLCTNGRQSSSVVWSVSKNMRSAPLSLQRRSSSVVMSFENMICCMIRKLFKKAGAQI